MAGKRKSRLLESFSKQKPLYSKVVFLECSSRVFSTIALLCPSLGPICPLNSLYLGFCPALVLTALWQFIDILGWRSPKPKSNVLIRLVTSFYHQVLAADKTWNQDQILYIIPSLNKASRLWNKYHDLQSQEKTDIRDIG